MGMAFLLVGVVSFERGHDARTPERLAVWLPLSGARVRAPELVGAGGWLNTGGRQLSLADLRGKIVLLDFWTFCCINCLHVIDELRPLEEKYADVLVIVGVHSPKFVHEADHDAVVAAVERYEVRPPGARRPRPDHVGPYAVRAWPTLALVDPEGYVVAQFSGEGHAHGIDALLAELVAEHEAEGHAAPRRRPVRPAASRRPTTLRFPAKAVALPDGSVLVADAGHHSLVELAAGRRDASCAASAAVTRGLLDGAPERPRSTSRTGCACCPPTSRRASATTSWSPTP